jgi:hypothetical protein
VGEAAEEDLIARIIVMGEKPIAARILEEGAEAIGTWKAFANCSNLVTESNAISELCPRLSSNAR